MSAFRFIIHWFIIVHFNRFILLFKRYLVSTGITVWYRPSWHTAVLVFSPGDRLAAVSKANRNQNKDPEDRKHGNWELGIGRHYTIVDLTPLLPKK